MRPPDYECDGVKLYCGDCLAILPTLEVGSVDAIITDLPYGTTACKWDNVIPFGPMWAAVKHVLKPRGVFVTTASQPFTSALVMSNPGWFRHEWIWEKDKAANILNAGREPLKVTESVIVFSECHPVYYPQKTPCKPYRHKNRSVQSDNFGKNISGYDENGYTEYADRHPRNIVYIPKDGATHPTQKPVALVEYLIKTYTNEGETVLDMTMGSGTTGVACVQTGRKFIGVELERKYFDIAVARIEKARAQMRLLP